MQYYYQFRAVIIGASRVGKKTLLNRLDHETDGNKIILSDQLSSTLYIYEFLHTQVYCADALCFVILFDQSSQETLNFALQKIQIILPQLNRGFQFIIIVQNKIDLPSKIHIDIHEYATNNQINLITLSAKTQFNVQLLANMLKLKAQQTMTKCSLSPYPLTDSLPTTPRQQDQLGTPDRPLPDTPQSQCKSIRSEVVQIEDFEISQIQNSLKKLDLKIENKLEQTVRNDNPPKRTPLKEIDQTNRKKYPKGIMNIVFTLNGQHHPVEIYREDSYALIVERLVQILNRRLKPLQKKHLIKIVETQINEFLTQLAMAATKPKQSQNIEKLFNHFNGHNIKQQIVGQIVLVIKQNIFKINISKLDDAYEIAFNSIMEFNLKRNSIQTLVDRIQTIQNPKNSTQMWVICDFIQQDLVIYVGENVDKKIFQFTMQHKLEYEQYKLLQLIN